MVDDDDDDGVRCGVVRGLLPSVCCCSDVVVVLPPAVPLRGEYNCRFLYQDPDVAAEASDNGDGDDENDNNGRDDNNELLLCPHNKNCADPDDIDDNGGVGRGVENLSREETVVVVVASIMEIRSGVEDVMVVSGWVFCHVWLRPNTRRHWCVAVVQCVSGGFPLPDTTA